MPKAAKKNKVLQDAKKVNELKHKDPNEMPQQDRAKLLKEMKYQQEFELMKQAARQNAEANAKAKQSHFNQFYNSSASSGITYSDNSTPQATPQKTRALDNNGGNGIT